MTPLKGNHQAYPRHLKQLFNEYCNDYLLERDVLAVAEEKSNFKIMEQAIKDKERAYQRINSVLDLHISLGGLTIEKVTNSSKYPIIEEIENAQS